MRLLIVKQHCQHGQVELKRTARKDLQAIIPKLLGSDTFRRLSLRLKKAAEPQPEQHDGDTVRLVVLDRRQNMQELGCEPRPVDHHDRE